jgi:hypothetical protein
LTRRALSATTNRTTKNYPALSMHSCDKPSGLIDAEAHHALIRAVRAVY